MKATKPLVGSGAAESAAAKEVRCPVCDSRDPHIFVTGERDYGREIIRSFGFYLCPKCRLRFQLVGDDEAATLFADVQESAARSRPSARRELRCDEDVLRCMQGMSSGRRLFEIGPGDGRFLAAARNHGFDCLGLDVSEGLAQSAAARAQVQVMVGKLTEVDVPGGPFDWVNLDQVLMYVPNPQPFMQKVFELMRPGGICRIRENNPDSVLARLHGKRYWMYSPTHVAVWAERTVRLLAEKTGLRIMRVIPGSECSLANWQASSRRSTFSTKIKDTAFYLIRKTRLLGISLAADTVYYLRRPEN